MEAKTQAITLKLVNKSFKLEIEPDKEETYRLAERMVNKYFALIQQEKPVSGWTDVEYLALTALQYAILYVSMRQSREVGGEDLRQLEAIGQEIDAYLNKLKG